MLFYKKKTAIIINFLLTTKLCRETFLARVNAKHFFKATTHTRVYTII